MMLQLLNNFGRRVEVSVSLRMHLGASRQVNQVGEYLHTDLKRLDGTVASGEA
jgi:hypothetical protein